jgi:hypothetical protein
MESAAEELRDCARYGELEEVRALLAASCACLDVADARTGNTALHYACANGHAEVVEALCEAGAMHLSNTTGNTPLQWAVQNGQKSCVRVLLERMPSSAQLSVLHVNQFGKSAVSDAFNAGDGDILKLVLEHASADEDMKKESGNERQPSPEHLSSNASVTHELCNYPDGPVIRIRELAPGGSGKAPLGPGGVVDDSTGVAIWGASIALWRWLSSDSLRGRIAGKRVLELGAGCGLVGIGTAVALSPSAVLLTDGNAETVDNLQHNLELNSHLVSPECAASVNCLDWVEFGASDGQPRVGPVDIVVGCDLVYDEAMVNPLLETLSKLLLPGEGVFFYACTMSERQGLDAFLVALETRGFELKSCFCAPQDYSSNPLASRDDISCLAFFPDLSPGEFWLREFRRC